jgi:hypothetical protein
MRARIMAVLFVAVSTVSLHSYAETSITLVAVNSSGQAVAVSTARNTFVIKATATSLPVKGKLTCLQIDRGKGGVGVPPAVVPLSAADVRISIKAGGVTYYVFFQSSAQRGNNHRQVVNGFGITKTLSANSPCGVFPGLKDSVGIVIYG